MNSTSSRLVAAAAKNLHRHSNIARSDLLLSQTSPLSLSFTRASTTTTTNIRQQHSSTPLDADRNNNMNQQQQQAQAVVPPQPRLSATVLVVSPVYDAKNKPPKSNFRIFMVKRSSQSSFMAGAYVFPGGMLDKADEDPQWRSMLSSSVATMFPDFSLRITAIREVFEESGIMLLEHRTTTENNNNNNNGNINPLLLGMKQEQLAELRRGVNADATKFIAMCQQYQSVPNAAALLPWAHWITPRQEKKRFDTMFYLANMQEMPFISAVHDESETVSSAWLAPEEALELFHKGSIWLAPPTWLTLKELCEKHADINSLTTFSPHYGDKHKHQHHRDLSVILPDLVPLSPEDTTHYASFINSSSSNNSSGGKNAVAVVLPGDKLHHTYNNNNNNDGSGGGGGGGGMMIDPPIHRLVMVGRNHYVYHVGDKITTTADYLLPSQLLSSSSSSSSSKM